MANADTDFLISIHRDPVTFTHALFRDRGLDKIAPLSFVEEDIVRFASTGPRRRVVLAFRGIGKTTLLTVGLALYRLYRDPNRKIIVLSKQNRAAVDTVKLIRSYIDQVWFLQHLRPRKDGRDNLNAFDVGPCKESRQPSVSAFGIEGQLEGNRAHTVLFDDVETKVNTKTIEGRTELDRLIKEATNIVYPDRPHAEGGPIDPVEIIGVGTPKHEDTLYVKQIKRGFALQSYPIRYPKDGENVINLAPILDQRLIADPSLKGTPTCPKRFNREEVRIRESEGAHEFAMEHMLIADMGTSHKYPIRLSDLIVYGMDRQRAPLSLTHGTNDHNGSTALPIPNIGFDHDRLHRPVFIDPTYAPYETTKAALDPAGRGTDKTGLSIVSKLAGLLYVHECLGLEGGHDPDKLDYIAQLLRSYNVRELYFESNIDNFGTFQGTLTAAIRKHFIDPGKDSLFPSGWACTVTPTRTNVQKELRIIGTLEPLISSHRLVVNPKALTPSESDLHLELQYQLSRITKQPKCLTEDGKIDSLELVCRHLNNATALNQHEHAERARQELLRTELAEMRRRRGIITPTPNWYAAP